MAITPQQSFLSQGGMTQSGLNKLEEQGAIDTNYQFREYPKEVRINHRVEMVEEKVTEITGERHVNRSEREVWDTVIVHNEDEEHKVMAGGRTERAAEDERQDLIVSAEQSGKKIDRRWSTDRIKREMGE